MYRIKLSTTLGALCAAIILATASPALSQNETEQAPPSLYQRLGGLPAISVVVSDFIHAMVPDSILNQNPAIDAARKRVPQEYLIYQVTAMVCMATGGPCEYRGRDMKSSHAHLNITQAEWDRMLVIFGNVMTKHKVPAKETSELLAILESTRADIVSAK